MSPLSAVEPLSPEHDCSRFDCGSPEITQWLRRYALQSQRSSGVRVYVRHRRDQVAGYYALAAGSVERLEAPARAAAGLGAYPIPVAILARLGVDRPDQGRGLGRDLFRDALLRIAQAADILGIRALLIHAQDDDAKRFYQQFDVDESPTDPLHLYLLLKDIRALIG